MTAMVTAEMRTNGAVDVAEASAVAGEVDGRVVVGGTRRWREWTRMVVAANQTIVAAVGPVVKGRAEWSTSVSTR
jgi:hypothetical protein